MKKILSIFRFVLPVLLVAVVLSSNLGLTTAATLSVANGSFTDGTGSSGSDWKDISSWEEEGSDSDSSTIGKNPSVNGEDIASPNGGRFAKIGFDEGNNSQHSGDDKGEWICQQLDSSGHNNLVLKYYWNGDSDTENNDDYGVVEYRATSNGNTDQTCNSNLNSWTQLASHDLYDDVNWSSLQSINLPDSLDNDSSWFIRFRNDASANNEYFRVDGVSIEGTPIDVCKNMEGIQTQIPQGYSVNNQNECIPDVVNVTVCKKDDQGNLLSGWMINLDWDSNVNHHWDATTGEDGCAYFNGIHSHDYMVSEVNQTNWSLVSLPNENGHIQAFNLQNGPYYIVNHYTPPTPTTATLSATKVVCDAEQYLPNWGDGAPEVDMTSTTALDWVTSSNGKCHLESGWQFEWTNDTQAQTGWTNFTNLTDTNGLTSQSIPTGGTVWVREVLKPGYIGFSGDTNGEDGWNDISAEMYCGADVLNYDNLDYVSNPQGGSTYNCVAFNALEEKPLTCNPEENLLKNGSFETPEVSTGNYGIFPQATLGLEWLVDWVNVSQVGTSGLEIQDNVAGAPAVGSGNQFAELDANHPVKISQDIPTIPGKEYQLSFKYSPRPGEQSGTNMLEARADGNLLGAVLSGVGGALTNWTSETRTFIADTNTKIEFLDTDTDNSYGGYLDDVSLTCLGDPAPQCNAEASSMIVSDTDTQVDDHDAVPVSFIHSAWAPGTTGIPGATWIWSEDNVSDATVDTTKVFTRDFNVVGTPLDSSIILATDNSYTVEVNGNLVPGCTDETVGDTDGDSFASPATCTISASMLNTGNNELSITVKNFARPGQTYTNNPAGLLYKLTLNNNECVTPPPPVLTSTVTMCKQNENIPVGDAGYYPMPGWTLTLTGDHVEDLSVPSNALAGVSTVNPLVAGASYVAQAVGTWLNQGGANPVDAEYSTTNAWSTQMDGYTGYQNDILELQIDNEFDPGSAWGVYNSLHKYAQVFVPSTTSANFRIFDGTGVTQDTGWYGDNSGSLAVSINKGFAGITAPFDNENPAPGCVTFTNVPYGTYTAGEIMQDGWENVSGLGAVTVDSPTEKFVILNQETPPPPATGSIEITKYTCPANFVPNRTSNGVGSVAPEGCTLTSGVAFGYVHGTQTDANDPYPELDGVLTPGGSTGEDGKLTIGPVLSAGRYLIKETNPANLLGLYCQGDGDTNPNNNDNQELTFVPANGVAKCVAYNKSGEVQGETATNNTTVVKVADLAADIPAVIATPTKWFFYNDETDVIDNVLGSFVTGPASAPAGTGSAQMSVTGTQRRNIATYQFKDVKLADIKTLTFSTYSQLAGDGALGLSERAPYLHFNVDFLNNDTWQKRLVYVPGMNGAVISDTWQTWDAINSGNALWVYSGATWPTTVDAGTTPKTWTQILALYPNAETRSTDSWFGFRVGEPYADGFTGNVDKFMMGIKTGLNTHTETYDFEPTAVVVNPACSDGLDNDEDERVDSEDPGCHSDGNVENPSSWVPEDNNEEDEKVVVEEEDDDSICSDGKDNDGDNVADFPEDEGCESAKDDSEDNRKILGGGGVFSRSGGSVLGASTDICDWDASYLRKGWKGNSPEDVKKVQNDLLNALEGHNLTVDGVFGPKTEEAIKAFQAKYAEDILKPWGIDSPTGLFYLSSLRQAQKLLCPEKEEALPQLINWSANPAL
ncbi:MAG: Flg new 2 protein [Patescibacteria group bacterium]|nr:Flg new 2 protein [Patescibacteria group bacterium]